METYTDKLYNTYQNIDNKKWNRLQRIANEWNSFILSEAKNKFPRRKIKDSNKAAETLGSDFVLATRVLWQERYNNVFYRYGVFKDCLLSELKKVAKDYIITPYADEYFKIESSNGGDYHTQGFGSNKYAKSSLKDSMMLIQLFGYQAEIR